MASPNLRRRSPRAIPASTGSETEQGPPVRAHQTHAEPGRPNPYPHRLSVDVDDDTYRALRLIAAQEDCRIVDLVRAGIAHEIDTHQ
jgi:hypothetical protein